MAKSIVLSAALSILNGGSLLAAGSSNKTVEQAGAGHQADEQVIGTVTEALTLVDIADIGYLYVENLDDTNFVEIGLATPVSGANAMITLKPGEFALLPTRQETIYAKADTNAVRLRVVLAEQ